MIDPPLQPQLPNRLGMVRPPLLLQCLRILVNVRFRVMRRHLTPNVPVEPEVAEVTGNRNEGMLPPTTSASRGMTMPVCGGVDTIKNDPYVLSIVTKGYTFLFTSPPLLLKTPWEIRSPQGPQKIQGM